MGSETAGLEAAGRTEAHTVLRIVALGAFAIDGFNSASERLVRLSGVGNPWAFRKTANARISPPP